MMRFIFFVLLMAIAASLSAQTNVYGKYTFMDSIVLKKAKNNLAKDYYLTTDSSGKVTMKKGVNVAGNGLTKTNDTIKLGGSLSGNTTTLTGGNTFTIKNNSGLQLLLTDSCDIFGNYAAGMQYTHGNKRLYSGIGFSDNFTVLNTCYDTLTQALTSVFVDSFNAGIFYSPNFNADSLNGFQTDKDENTIIAINSDSGVIHTSWVSNVNGVTDVHATIYRNGDWKWNNYPYNRVDDVANHAPINYLYTDNDGNVLMCNTNQIVLANEMSVALTANSVINVPETLGSYDSYFVQITPTNATMAAQNYYVANKTSGGFDVILTAPITGTVTFDYFIRRNY